MTEQESHRYPLWLRKLVIPALIGAAAGFAGSYVLLDVIDSDAVGELSTSRTLAAPVGMLYLAIPFGIMVGTLNPKVGVRFLNVEDTDELREQKRILISSGGPMALWGAALLALAMAAPEGPIPQGVALVIGAGELLLGTALSYVTKRSCDELMLAVNLEAGAISYSLVLMVVGLWAMLAHLGFVTGPQPLDLLTLFYVLVLVVSFIAVGRRGMLTVK